MSNLITKTKNTVIGLFEGLCKGKGKGRILRVFTIGDFKGKSQGYSLPIRERIPFTLKPEFLLFYVYENTLLCIHYLRIITGSVVCWFLQGRKCSKGFLALFYCVLSGSIPGPCVIHLREAKGIANLKLGLQPVLFRRFAVSVKSFF